jgi:hypothetical protein
MPHPNQTQILQNPAKPGHTQPKRIKEKSLDFLGFSCPKRAFSRGCADPPGQKISSGSIPSQLASPSPRFRCPKHAPNITRASDFHKQNAWAKFGDDGGRDRLFAIPRAIRAIP